MLTWENSPIQGTGPIIDKLQVGHFLCTFCSYLESLDDSSNTYTSLLLPIA